MSALQYFEKEFRAHILDKECPAGTCKDLVRSRCINACRQKLTFPPTFPLSLKGNTPTHWKSIVKRTPLP